MEAARRSQPPLLYKAPVERIQGIHVLGGAFSYNKKGPCHIWEDKTKAEKLACKVELDRRNALRVDDDRASWQLKQDIENSEYKRIHGRKKPGKQLEF